MVLVVANSAQEDAYAPALEAHQFGLYEFSSGSPEIDKMLLFRDWLHENAADRGPYSRTKLAVAQQEWEDIQDYADAKSAVVEEIMARARAAVDRTRYR
jgi:GrpB-like predicted nucleotidyltransferase (UPF0157 family)